MVEIERFPKFLVRQVRDIENHFQSIHFAKQIETARGKFSESISAFARKVPARMCRAERAQALAHTSVEMLE